MYKREANGHVLLTIHLKGAIDADEQTLRAAVTAAYQRLAQYIDNNAIGHPIRIWNFIPDINGMLGELERYMVFNAGRHDGFVQWLGEKFADSGMLPTASGVGHDGADLIIHCLCSDQPSRSIENPRQCPAYQYSRRYGPVPPSFARGTLLENDHPPTLLVAGTASVLGEQTVHVGDLQKQLDETLTNLACVVASAAGRSGQADDRARWLGMYRHLSVYCPDAGQLETLYELIHTHFPNVRQVELIRADLCRADLLVEIEGVAELTDLRARSEDVSSP